MVTKMLSPENLGPDVPGKSWLKLKRVVSLDLVIVAADWGCGRRHGWLSNQHFLPGKAQ